MNNRADQTNDPPVGQASTSGAAQSAVSREELLNVLKNVYDPDLQMSVVDLGLIYDLQVASDGRVRVKMTLTSPHCPYGPALVGEVKAMLTMVHGVNGVEVEVVWDPPWSSEKMSQEARLMLGLDV